MRLASELAKARADANMTPEQVARGYGDDASGQCARVGRREVRAYTRTLERFAKATHTRLRDQL